MFDLKYMFTFHNIMAFIQAADAEVNVVRYKCISFIFYIFYLYAVLFLPDLILKYFYSHSSISINDNQRKIN